jgi:hypothetical protein
VRLRVILRRRRRVVGEDSGGGRGIARRSVRRWMDRLVERGTCRNLVVPSAWRKRRVKPRRSHLRTVPSRRRCRRALLLHRRRSRLVRRLNVAFPDGREGRAWMLRLLSGGGY